MSETAAERLERGSIPVPFSGCRIWTGATDSCGYGRLRWKGKIVKAHRLAWESHFGPIPDGMEVCHRCDTPPCDEPSHLFLGTHLENHRDKADKRRGPKPPSGLPRGVMAKVGRSGRIRYSARRSYDGQHIWLGAFATIEEAAAAAEAWTP